MDSQTGVKPTMLATMAAEAPPDCIETGAVVMRPTPSLSPVVVAELPEVASSLGEVFSKLA